MSPDNTLALIVKSFNSSACII